MKEKLFTRNFTLLLLGQSSSLIGNYILKFALSMYVLEQTGSATVFAALLAVSMIPTILLSPFGGILADRLNRINMMVTLDALSGVSVLAVFFLFRESVSLPLIGALLFLLSILGAFETPTVQACIPQMLYGRNLLKGNAMVNQIQAVATLVTPFAGSVFYAAVGLKSVLTVTAVCFFLTALLECFIRLEYQKTLQKQPFRKVIKGDFAESWNFLQKEQPQILKLLLLAALVSFFVMGVMTVGFPFLVRTVLELSAEHYGVAESIMGIAAILSGVLVSLSAQKIKLQKLYRFMVILGLCLFPVGISFLLPIGPFVKYLVLVAMFFIGQVSCGMFSIVALTTIQERTPKKLTGKVMSYVMTISLCAQPLGQFAYGFLFDIFQKSVWWALLPTGFIVCGIGWLTRGFFQRLQKSPPVKNEKREENACL